MIPFKKFVNERTNADIIRGLTGILDPKATARGGKRGEIRISPKEKGAVTEDEVRAAFERLNLKLVKVVPKKTETADAESKSSKYPTHVVVDDNNVEHYVILTGGAMANTGMAFERQKAEEVKANMSPELQAQNPLFKAIKQVVGSVNFVESEVGFGQLVKRQLSGKPNDVGPSIADLVLIDDTGKKYYISLKASSGKTIANNGIGNTFELKGTTVITHPNAVADKLFAAAHFDKEEVARGVEAYMKQVVYGKKEAIQVSGYDEQTLLDYLGSAIDYGYYYVRGLKSDTYEVYDLTTKDKMENTFLGKIHNVKVQYPYYHGPGAREKRKSADIIVTTITNAPVTEPGDASKSKLHTFTFQIRNASGDIVPKQINLIKGTSTDA